MQVSRPRVRTSPPATAWRNLAGSVRRFLSSMVCSYSPRSMVHASPLYPTSLHNSTPRRHSHVSAFHCVSEHDASRGDPALRALLRGQPRRGVRPPRAQARTATGRGRLPGDLPARAARVRGAGARRAPPSLGADDRRPDRNRPAPAQPAHRGASRPARRGRAARLRAARPAHRLAAPEGAGRGGAPLRLRHDLRRDRRCARLERGGGPPDRVLRSPAAARKGVRMTVPIELDRRFRDTAASEGLLDVAYDLADSPVGALLVAATGRGLCRISFTPDEALDGLAEAFGARILRVPRQLDPVRRQLDEYFEHRRTEFDLDTDLSPLPEFQRGVLTELARVPFGQVTTYGALAGKIGRPRAARAVGGALNRNPVPIVLPCHRVVGASGSLTGYAGGLDRKEALLRLEGALL